MKNYREHEVELPGGYEIDGKIEHKVVMREMTGYDEEILASKKVQRNRNNLITELLFSVVSSIGEKKPTREDIRNLLGGDRDYLVLMLQKISFGDSVEMNLPCPRCESNLTLDINIDDIEVTRLENGNPRSVEITLDGGYMDEKGTIHKDLEIEFPTGRVQEAITSLARENPAKASTAMFLRCCKRFGTLERITDTVFKSLTKRDRDKIRGELDKATPGPNPMISVTCIECGNEFEAMMDVSNFFVGK